MSSPKLTRSNSLPANIGTGTPPPASSPGQAGKAGQSSSHAASHLMPHAKKRGATTEGSTSMAPRGGLSQLSGTKSRDLPNPFENLESQWDAPMPMHTNPHSGPPSTSFTPPPFSLMDMDMGVYPPQPPHTDPPSDPPFDPPFDPPSFLSRTDDEPRDIPESRAESSEDRMEALMEMQERAALNSVAMQMATARNNEIIAEGQAALAASEMQAKAAKSAFDSTKGLM